MLQDPFSGKKQTPIILGSLCSKCNIPVCVGQVCKSSLKTNSLTLRSSRMAYLSCVHSVTSRLFRVKLYSSTINADAVQLY